MDKNNSVYISVVVPIFNEEKHVVDLHTRLTNTLTSIKREYEIILVDDGSRDKSFEIMKSLYEKDKRLKVIQLSRNFGQHPAVIAGFKIAKGEIIVTLDADLQNPPEEIPVLIKKSEEGYSVVSGWRVNRQDNSNRLFLSGIGNILVSKLTGIKLHDYGCMMRAYKREVIDQVLMCPEKYKTIPALIAWLAPSSVVEVKLKHDSRKYGKSNYKMYDLLRLAFGLIVGYSTLPLQLISLFGMVMTITGFCSLAVLLFNYLFFSTIPATLVSLVSVFLFFYGFLIFAIGLIGEYVGRIFVEVQGRPYFIMKTLLD
jgi:undecaprenyl-phosphate 4-deoxy-4-formamido-L-arabinose transferase